MPLARREPSIWDAPVYFEGSGAPDGSRVPGVRDYRDSSSATCIAQLNDDLVQEGVGRRQYLRDVRGVAVRVGLYVRSDGAVGFVDLRGQLN